ncbi:MAG: hypothetical protein WAU39_07385 [Polyangiales bacterium]
MSWNRDGIAPRALPYNTDGTFPTIYEKVKPEIDPLQFLEQERGWRDERSERPVQESWMPGSNVPH